MVKCNVKDDWLINRKDQFGNIIGTWAKKISVTKVFCNVCSSTINCEQKGFQAIQQHSKTELHLKNVRAKLPSSQLRLSAILGDVNNNASGSSAPAMQMLNTYNIKDTATRAELLWTMKNVACNMSANSCEGIANLFEAMFPGAVPQGFSLGKTKLNYLMTEALGPFFRQTLLDDVRNSFYTLIFDETTNSEGKKELQIALRFWSESEHQVCTHHLETFFIAHATAKDLLNSIKKSLDNGNLSLSKMLMLGSDGPSVNKKVFKDLNEEMKQLRGIGLINIGSCNIHTVHNAFLKGLNKLGISVSDLIIAIYYFFSGWPARWEDFTKIQDELRLPRRKFIKHVPSRWLTLEDAAKRLYMQWRAVEKYFLDYLPKKSNSETLKSQKYKKIVQYLKEPCMKATLIFVIQSAEIYVKFTGTFQKEEPLIHVMYESLSEIIFTLTGRVCKAGILTEIENISDAFVPANLIAFNKLTFDEDILQALSKVKEREKLEFYSNAQKHYVSAAEHILTKTSLGFATSNNLIKCFSCLQPKKIKQQKSCKHILQIAKEMPFEISTSVLLDEWKLLQLENLELDKCEDYRIDNFWKPIFLLKNGSGCIKYPTVTKIVKNVLALSHGSADIERGFSKSSRVLTKDKTLMTEKTLNSRLNILDGLKKYNNRPELVPITKSLLSAAQMAHKSYVKYMEEKKREAERTQAEAEKEKERVRLEAELLSNMELERKSITNLEKRLSEIQNDGDVSTPDKLLEEANDRLKKAIAAKNIPEIQLAQGMLEGVKILLNNRTKKSKEISEYKNKLITSHLNKKQKL